MPLGDTPSELERLGDDRRERIERRASAVEGCEEFAAECSQHDADYCQVWAGVSRECAERCRDASSQEESSRSREDVSTAGETAASPRRRPRVAPGTGDRSYGVRFRREP